MIAILAPVLGWWLALSLIGLLALPIARALLPTLPDRGLSLARPLGLLLAGYTWWLGATLGVLPSSRLGAWLALLPLAGVGLWLARRHLPDIRAELRGDRALLIGYEALFAAAFLGWALYRAFYPDITWAGGEKTMELAFLSGILESPRFPPADPWMSGESISYYYFGYVVAAQLVHLTGISRYVAINLVVPMTLGLTLVGAFGMGRALALHLGAGRALRLASGAFTATILALASNLSGALEVAYRAGWLPASFFAWLGVRELSAGGGACTEQDVTYAALASAPRPLTLLDYLPDRFLWWWRGSRILHDGCGEIIHEFPFFSFMLADVHPHVMALPYVLLVLGLAYAILRGALARYPGQPPLAPAWLALPLCLGSLAFLNTWDLPTYGFVMVFAFALWRSTQAPRSGATQLRDGAAFAVWLVALAFLLYLPFHLGLSSQAQGLGLARFSSHAGRWLVHFGLLAFLALSLLGLTSAGLARRRTIAGYLALVAALLVLPFLPVVATSGLMLPVAVGCLAALVGLLPWRVGPALTPAARLWLAAAPSAALVLLVRWAGGSGEGAVAWTLDPAAATWTPWTPWLLGLAVTAAGAVGFARWEQALAAAEPEPEPEPEPNGDAQVPARDLSAPASETAGEEPAAARDLPIPAPERAIAFALVCVTTGLLLAWGTEHVYIRDFFDNRMNTVFKLYYQAWVLLAVGGGLALPLAWRRWRRTPAGLWSAATAVLLALSLVYTAGSVWTRTEGLRLGLLREQGAGAWTERLSLDGIGFWRDFHPDELEAAACLMAAAEDQGQPHILEASGGSYGQAGRIAMVTGLPTVLGADWHEIQWRGSHDEVNRRKADVEAFFSGDPSRMDEVLDRYDVRYVVLGPLERSSYPTMPQDFEDRLDARLRPVCETGAVRVWAR